MVQRLKVVIISLLLLLATGCWDSIPVENRALGVVMGVDYLPDAPHYLFTLVYPLVGTDKAQASRLQVVRAHTLAEAYALWNHSNSDVASFGKLLATVFGREAAEQGVVSIINDLFKHPDIRTSSNIIVTDGRAVDLLSVVPADGQRIGLYLRDLLATPEKHGDGAVSPLFLFTTSMMTPGMDPITVIVNPIGTMDARPPDQRGATTGEGGDNGSDGGSGSNKQEDVQITGAAIWQGDKMVGALTLPESQYISIVSGQPKNMPLQFLVPDHPDLFPSADRIVCYIESSKPKWSLTMENGIPHFKLSLKVRLTLQNYQGNLNLTEDENMNILKDSLKQTISTNSLAVLQKVANTGSDPLFLGQQVRIKYPDYWDSRTWTETLKKAQFRVETDITVKMLGYQVTRFEPIEKTP